MQRCPITPQIFRANLNYNPSEKFVALASEIGVIRCLLSCICLFGFGFRVQLCVFFSVQSCDRHNILYTHIHIFMGKKLQITKQLNTNIFNILHKSLQQLCFMSLELCMFSWRELHQDLLLIV